MQEKDQGRTVLRNVPYYSQLIDVPDRYWMVRSCAIVCLKMVLEFHGKASNVSIMELIKKGEAIGGYGKSGWFHDATIKLASEFGLEGNREEKMEIESGIGKIKNFLEAGSPVIISAVKYILGQTKFHQVVMVGYKEEEGKLLGFFYHDPEATEKEKGMNIFVDIETFKQGWREMAIFLKK